MRVIPLSQEGEGILRKELPMCSGMSRGGAHFPCHSQVILIAPLSLSHWGLKGTTLANSLQGYSSG